MEGSILPLPQLISWLGPCCIMTNESRFAACFLRSKHQLIMLDRRQCDKTIVCKNMPEKKLQTCVTLHNHSAVSSNDVSLKGH